MWFIYALATSLCSACYYMCNQNSKLNSHIFITYRGFIPAFVILPVVVFIPPAFMWPFFLIAVLQGLAVSYLDYNIYKLFQKYGAEAVSSINPLSVLITFVFWLVVRPTTLMSYMQNISRFMLIVFSVCAIVYAVMKYRRQPFLVSCLHDMFPLLLIFSFIDITNKLIMEYADNHLISATIYRVFIVSIIIGIVNLMICRQKGIPTSAFFKKENLRASWFILLNPLSMILVNFSMFYAENPAYTSAVVYLSVVWILLFNKIRQYAGLPTKNQPIVKKWIILLLAATILLIITTSNR